MKKIYTGIDLNVSTSGEETPRAGGPVNAALNVTVQRYWYLRVEVTDLAGVSIPARIVVADHHGNVVKVGEADVEGVYRSLMLAEVVNGSETLFTGNYRVRAEYLNYTTGFTPIVLDGNRELKLRFLDYVPLNTTTILTVSPTLVKVGDPVNVRGWIVTGQPGEYVELVAVGPGGLRIESAYRTGEGGVFEGEFKPTREGRWDVYAEWLGRSRPGMSTKSRAFFVTAEPRPSLMVLFLRALPILIVVIGVIAGLAFLALTRMRGLKI